jgi:hypothetical protein
MPFTFCLPQHRQRCPNVSDSFQAFFWIFNPVLFLLDIFVIPQHPILPPRILASFFQKYAGPGALSLPRTCVTRTLLSRRRPILVLAVTLRRILMLVKSSPFKSLWISPSLPNHNHLSLYSLFLDLRNCIHVDTL